MRARGAHALGTILVSAWLTASAWGSSSDLAWEMLYDGPDHGYDMARAVAVDDDGNIYVCGNSESEVPFTCEWQEWHNENTTMVWTDPVRRFQLGGPGYFVRFTATAVCTLREARFLYGCGSTFLEPTVIVRVYGNTGPVSGSRMYPDISPDGPNLLGSADVRSADLSCYPNWTTVDLTSLGPLVFQPGQEFFISTSKDPNSPPLAGDTAKFHSDDGTSMTGRSGYWDNSAGEFLYFDETGTDYGLSTEAGVCCGMEPAYDLITIKYDPNGVVQWVTRYAGPAGRWDLAHDIDLSQDGSIYVTGYSEGLYTDKDVLTIKLAPDGSTVWARIYDGPDGLEDMGLDMVLDDAGNVYVTGRSLGSLSDWDVVTIKYSTDGDFLWSQHYNGSANLADHGRAIVLDGAGGVYVGGNGDPDQLGSDLLTIKYDVNGAEQWARFHDGPAGETDYLYGMAIDANGHLYAVGETFHGTDSEWITVKYDQSGTFHWSYIDAGYAGTRSPALEIVVDDDLGYVHIAGKKVTPSLDAEIVTTTLQTIDGGFIGTSTYDGGGSPSNTPESIILGTEGNFYVTGYSGSDCITLKYNNYNALVMEWRYSSPGLVLNHGVDIAIDACGDVIVVGEHDDFSGNADCLTIKYAVGCRCPYQCDFDEDGFITSLDLGTLIDVLFAGQSDEQDTWCPTTRGDFDCDGFSTALDLGMLIDHLFAGGDGPCDPCGL